MKEQSNLLAIDIPTSKGIARLQDASDIKNLVGKVLKFEIVYSNQTETRYYFANIIDAIWILRSHQLHLKLSPINLNGCRIDGAHFHPSFNHWNIQHDSSNRPENSIEWGLNVILGRGWLLI